MTRLLIPLAVLFFGGCSGKKEVAAIAKSETPTPSIDVPELLKHHERFRGREVELTGWASRDDSVIFLKRRDRPEDDYPRIVAIGLCSPEEFKKFKDLPVSKDLRVKEVRLIGTVGREDALKTILLTDCRFVEFPKQPGD